MRILTLVLILFFSANLKALAVDKVATQENLWAIADSHGAYDELVRQLKQVKLIDESNNWIGGKAHLVSTGDTLDRGPGSRKILDLLIQLEKQAKAAGGGFHLLLGNHEVMVLTGDLRYVSAAEYEEFAADESAQIRDKYYRKQLAYLRLSDPELKDTDSLREQFDKQHPPGFFARFEAFGQQGKYGSWLLQKNILMQVNDSVFVHGGLSPALYGQPLSSLNQQFSQTLSNYVADWHQMVTDGQLPAASSFRKRLSLIKAPDNKVERFKRHYQSLLFNRKGPVWYRGGAYCHPYYERASLEKLLNQFNARRLFVGHTVTDSLQVERRLGDQIYMMDTGMLHEEYKGQASILQIKKSQVKVFDTQERDYAGKPASATPAFYPGELTPEELKKILVAAPTQKIEKSANGTKKLWRLEFMHNNKTIKASFNFSEENLLDLAAYRLSELLGFNMVPMAVSRTIDERQGVVSFRPKKSYTALRAEKKKLKYRGHCSYNQQQNMMMVFDLLIDNQNRAQDSIIFEQRGSRQILWTAHQQAFSTNHFLTKSIDKKSVWLSQDMRQALADLTGKKIEQAMQGLLDAEQISALLSRRDKILTL